MAVRIDDDPRADEIVGPGGYRLRQAHPRIGGLKMEDTKKGDGLR